MSKQARIQKIFTEDQRLVILRTLAESPNYRSNDSILDDVLEAYSHNVSRDKVRNHLNWLAEQELVIIERLDSTMIATLTQRGLDVSKGDANCEGVKRPEPGL